MKGFDPRFKDLPDYILGITEEIREDRGFATLHQYCTGTIPVRSPGALVVGNVDIIAATGCSAMPPARPCATASSPIARRRITRSTTSG